MGRGLLCVAGVALVGLLLAVLAATLRLLLLVVHLVTLRYTLVIGSLAFTLWFGVSRHKRCARGFYSCSQVPSEPKIERAVQLMHEQQAEDREKKQKLVVAVVVPLAERVRVQLKKVAATPAPSETESEDDENEATEGLVAGVNTALLTSVPPASSSSASSSSSPSGPGKRLADVGTRRAPIDEELQQQQQQRASRPRSSSAADDGRVSLVTVRRSVESGTRVEAAELERKCRAPRRRADTGTTDNNTSNNKNKNKSNAKQPERARRATFMSKQDAHTAGGRSSSDRLEDALSSDGYWIGDFSMQRRLVSRRSYTSSPKAK